MKLLNRSVRELVGFDDKWLAFLGIPILAALTTMSFFQILPWEQLSLFLEKFYIALFFVSLHWVADWLVIVKFRDLYPDVNSYKYRLLYQGIAIFITTLIISNSSIICMYIISMFAEDPQPAPMSKILLASFFDTLIVVSIYEVIYMFNRWRFASIESEQLKKANMQAQLETLKNQVNPHFLFNSLNALTSIIHDQPDQAVEFVQKLSKVYRYILEIKNRELITLGEEMSCVEAYKFLLTMRFGENVKFEIDVAGGNFPKHIVPLSLQIALENAIKHNIISSKKPLLISIKVGENGNVLVSNNLQRKPNVEGSTQTGIANIQKRYKLLADREVDAIVSQEKFTLSLPLIDVASA